MELATVRYVTIGPSRKIMSMIYKVSESMQHARVATSRDIGVLSGLSDVSCLVSDVCCLLSGLSAVICLVSGVRIV